MDILPLYYYAPYNQLNYGVYNSPSYGPSNTLNTDVSQKDVYDVQPINRYFTHERNHILRTVHHKVYQVQDIHNVVDTYSNQEVYAYPQTRYGGSYWNPYGYS
ncbi:MAG: hypothetical protein AABX70_03510 [Nanoarchaeota archaeon]